MADCTLRPDGMAGLPVMAAMEEVGGDWPVRAAAVLGGPRGGRHSSIEWLRDLLEYLRACRRLEASAEELDCLFRRFLEATVGRRCMGIGFDPDLQPSLGPNWSTVDLAQLNAGEDAPSLDVRDGQIDVIFCTGLHRVAHPVRLVAEIRRVLRQAGQVWIQAPCHAPYPPHHSGEFWRITPEGLRMLMRNFDEIFCAAYLAGGSALRATSFFYGLRPGDGECTA